MRADLEVVARSSSKSARFVRGLRATLRRPDGRGRFQEISNMLENWKLSREAATTNFWTGRWRNAVAVMRLHVGEGRGAVEDWSPSDAVWRCVLRPTKLGRRHAPTELRLSPSGGNPAPTQGICVRIVSSLCVNWCKCVRKYAYMCVNFVVLSTLCTYIILCVRV